MRLNLLLFKFILFSLLIHFLLIEMVSNFWPKPSFNPETLKERIITLFPLPPFPLETSLPERKIPLLISRSPLHKPPKEKEEETLKPLSLAEETKKNLPSPPEEIKVSLPEREVPLFEESKKQEKKELSLSLPQESSFLPSPKEKPEKRGIEKTPPEEVRVSPPSEKVPSLRLLNLIREKIAKEVEYPFLARRQGIEGKTLVEFQIKSNGQVEKLRIVESSGNYLLDQASLEGVKKAAPLPYVVGRIKIPIVFQLKEE